MAGRVEGRGRSRGLLALLALEAVSQYWRLDRKPPLTAGLIAANTLVYLRPSFLQPLLPSIHQVWFNPHLILKYKDLKRFFLSPFYHVGEPHLFYNMLSLLWKGTQLENSMSSVEFASMVASLLAMSQGITLLLAKSLLVLFDYGRPYYSEYSAGFSGVLFAMKVILNSRSGSYTNVYGVIVPSRYAAWAELVLIQLFVPGVSFLGHLGGILAGIAYLRLKNSFSGPDPLELFVRGVLGVIGWPMRMVKDLFQWRQQRISGRGRVGGGGSRESRRGLPESWVPWRCNSCTYDNHGLLSVCEMCGTSRSRSGGDSDFAPPLRRLSDDHPSLDELRRRRVERFGS